MYEIDLTTDSIEVLQGEGDALVILTTGCDPTKGQDSVCLIEPGGNRIVIDPQTGATTTQKDKNHNVIVSQFVARERVLVEPGTYEVKSQFRRGSERTFLLDVTDSSLTVRKGSSPAYWILADLDPVRNDPKSDLLLYSEGGVALAQET